MKKYSRGALVAIVFFGMGSAARAADFHADGGFDVAEIRLGQGADELAWESTFSIGNHLNRALVKFDGGGALNQRIEDIEIQGLYSRILSDHLSLMAGARHDPRAPGKPVHAVAGFEANLSDALLAESFVYVDDDGKITGDAKLIYEYPITSKLLADARWALAWSAQDIQRDESRSGVTDTEWELRLRYTASNVIIPYVGVRHARLLGATADDARLAGEKRGTTQWMIGLSVGWEVKAD